MRVRVVVIPHGDQRYPTLGDWVFGDGELVVTVSDTGDEEMNFLIALHEQVEAMLCLKRGIAEEVVSGFDMANPSLNDPGLDPRAPYHREHLFAEHIERRVAGELGVNWKDYEKRCEALCASS
jgi:hypothetical protein